MPVRVLWMGDKGYSVALMKAFSGRLLSCYAGKVSSGYLRENPDKFDAAVINSGWRDVIDPGKYRALLEFSAEKRFPVLIMGREAQFMAVLAMFPKAFIRQTVENTLLADLEAALDKSGVEAAVLCFTPEYFAFCEEASDMSRKTGQTELRFEFCIVGDRGMAGIRSRVRDADLLIFCGEAVSLLPPTRPGLGDKPIMLLNCPEDFTLPEEISIAASADIREGCGEFIEKVIAAAATLGIKDAEQPEQ